MKPKKAWRARAHSKRNTDSTPPATTRIKPVLITGKATLNALQQYATDPHFFAMLQRGAQVQPNSLGLSREKTSEQEADTANCLNESSINALHKRERKVNREEKNDDGERKDRKGFFL